MSGWVSRVRADSRAPDIEPQILCGDLQGQVQRAQDIAADRQLLAAAFVCMYRVIRHDDESVRDSLYERYPPVVHRPAGTSGYVALVVRADGSAPRAALRYDHIEAQEQNGEDHPRDRDDSYLCLRLLSVLQVGYAELYAFQKSLCLPRL